MSSIFILKDDERRDNCIKYLQSISLSKPLTVTISNNNRKSRNQESYWHKLIGIIAEHVGENPKSFKMKLKYEWLPLEPIKTMGGKEYLYPVTTRELTKAEYADLIARTLALGHELGLVMPLASFYGMEER